MYDNTLSRYDLIRSLSTRLFPITLGQMLDWSDWLWIHCGMYTQALRNSVRYFLGDISIEVRDTDKSGSEERDQVRTDLIDSYRIFDLLGRAGDEYVQWGNSFSTVAPAVRRILHCRQCGATFPAKQCEDLRYGAEHFTGTCPICQKKGLTLDNTESMDDTVPLQVTFWNPRLIDIDYCPTTRTCEYYLNPSKEWIESFGRQNKTFICETRIEFLQALDKKVRIKMDGKYFKHLKPPLPSTIEDGMLGWGLPLYISEFGKVIEILMLKRYNEAILSDYLIPFRVISPPPSGGNPDADPMRTYNMSDFRSRIMEMVSSHRANPTEIHVAPFPLQYQLMGGEAKSLIPMDVLDKCVADLLSSMCIPIEFAQMTIANSGGPPVGLRRFEKVWATNIAALDEWLQWLCDCRTDILRSPAVRCRLVKASIYDDDMSRDLKTKLAMASVISKGTALRPLGIDYESEQLLMRDEADREQKLGEEKQVSEEKRGELQGAMVESQPGVGQLMAAQQGGMPPGGAPMPPPSGPPPQGAAGGAPADIEQLWAQAESMAPQILTAPASERRSMLINLSKENPQLHAFVKSMVEKMEQQAGQQGVNAAREGQM